MVRNSCRVWPDRMNPETIIAMDGSRSRRRNAMHCAADFVDSYIKTLLDFDIIEKQIGFIHGNYFGASNRMEVEGVRHLRERWKENNGLIEKVPR
jgi:hypothetical protein